LNDDDYDDDGAADNNNNNNNNNNNDQLECEAAVSCLVSLTAVLVPLRRILKA
jgi:hypothetical protein